MAQALNLDPVADWPVGAASVVVVTPDATVASTGDLDQPWPWASVTKLLVAVAALIAVEEGTVTLDTAAGPEGSTLRHLLAHTSGLAFDSERVLAPPATKRIYSNAGIEAAARCIEERSDIDFPTYLSEAVLTPLGMEATKLEGSPAWGAIGPARDLARLAAELLAPTLISPATLARAVTPSWPELAGVLPGFGRYDPNPFGLGFEVRGDKRPHWTGSASSPSTFGHFGQSGAFLWVDPVADVACGCLTDTDFGTWAKSAWPELSDRVLGMISATDGQDRTHE